jgi:hypothetical protein
VKTINQEELKQRESTLSWVFTLIYILIIVVVGYGLLKDNYFFLAASFGFIPAIMLDYLIKRSIRRKQAVLIAIED